MAHINDLNIINFNNLPIINNEIQHHEIEWDIGWVIDRRPDFNIINNINNLNNINNINIRDNDIMLLNNLQNIRNEVFDHQVIQATQALVNGAINFQHNEDDFIPFEPQPIHIETEVIQIDVSEEERDCPICYETREYHDISRVNCGHKFCGNCITEHVRRHRDEPRCPLCRANITHISFQTHEHNANFLEM